jgi:hypothetical protein
MELNEPTERIFNLDERLVRFAGESIFFVRKLARAYELEYYKNQLIRSSGSASLNIVNLKEQLLIKITFLNYH